MDRKFNEQTAAGASGEPPSGAWLFAQALLGKPVPSVSRARADAQAGREQLEWLASISTEHERQLRRLKSAEAEARRRREQLQWLAKISTKHESQLRRLLAAEAEAREAQARWDRFAESSILQESDPSKHPRRGGPPNAGWFATTGGAGGSASAAPSKQASPGGAAAQPAQPPTTKPQLPAGHRGTWISGTKGNGVFRYNDSVENQQAGVAGKDVRFENQHIAVGAFPPDSYYGGSAASASVEIETVTGKNADKLAADAEMRKKLGNPAWQRPKGYRWNHAGLPGSKVMELVRETVHSGVAHKGPAAVPRAQLRTANAGGMTSRAMGTLTVYLVARDALQTGGLLKPDYEVAERETYHFRAEDGSVFVVRPGGLFSSAERRFIDGPRKGQTEKITDAEVERYRKRGEEEFGKYIPGSRISEPRFIPGRQRTTLPLIIHKHGIPFEAGWIDEKGVHHYSVPRALPI